MLKIRGMSNAQTPFTKLCNNWNIPLLTEADKGFYLSDHSLNATWLLLWCSVIKPELTLFFNCGKESMWIP
jgi:hypothetical protein